MELQEQFCGFHPFISIYFLGVFEVQNKTAEDKWKDAEGHLFSKLQILNKDGEVLFPEVSVSFKTTLRVNQSEELCLESLQTSIRGEIDRRAGENDDLLGGLRFKSYVVVPRGYSFATIH